MARRKSSSPATKAGKSGETRLPSPDPITNVVIADIVLRSAGSLVRRRFEKGILTGQIDSDKAKRMIDGRGMASTLALWGASKLATRSPLGLAVVAGGLAAKVFYDRGKRLDAKRRAKDQADPES